MNVYSRCVPAADDNRRFSDLAKSNPQRVDVKSRSAEYKLRTVPEFLALVGFQKIRIDSDRLGLCGVDQSPQAAQPQVRCGPDFPLQVFQSAAQDGDYSQTSRIHYASVFEYRQLFGSKC